MAHCLFQRTFSSFFVMLCTEGCLRDTSLLLVSEHAMDRKETQLRLLRTLHTQANPSGSSVGLLFQDIQNRCLPNPLRQYKGPRHAQKGAQVEMTSKLYFRQHKGTRTVKDEGHMRASGMRCSEAFQHPEARWEMDLDVAKDCF